MTPAEGLMNRTPIRNQDKTEWNEDFGVQEPFDHSSLDDSRDKQDKLAPAYASAIRCTP